MLKSNLFRPGTKFIVREESVDKNMSPHSTGFLSFIKGRDRDYTNVVYFLSVKIRQGKTGRHRMDLVDVCCPIFEPDVEGMKNMLPDPSRKFFTLIRRDVEAPHNIIEMANMDYLGWAVSYSKFLEQVCSRMDISPVWPKDKNNMIRRMTEIPNIFEDCAAEILDDMTHLGARKAFVLATRRMEYTLVKRMLIYYKKVASLGLSAIRDISKVVENEGKSSVCLHDGGIKQTLEQWETKFKRIALVEENYGRKDRMLLVKNADIMKK